MGKSGKKSKLDKINALRKQYDAFLDEDKMRKIRNKYILGKMETMRSSTALVHVSSKVYPKTEESDYSSQPKFKSTMAHISNSAVALSGCSHAIPKYSDKIYDDPSLLREISKKYFLIPKVMSDYNVNYKDNNRDQSPTGDTDWKSKYNILDELKREEKEEQSNTIYEKQNNLYDLYEDNKSSEYIPRESNEKSNVQNDNKLSLELKPSKPEIDMFQNEELAFNNLEVKKNQNKEEQVDKTSNSENIGVDELNMEKQELASQSNKLHNVNLSAHSPLPKESHVENNIKQDTMLFSINNKTHEIKESNELQHEEFTSQMEPIAGLENNKYLPEAKKCIEFNESQDNTAHCTMKNDNENLSPILNNESNEFSVQNIEANQEIVNNENTVRAQVVYEEVAGHVQDDPAIENTGHQEYKLQESDLNKIQNVEQNVTSEVNDELETEQIEMFYSQDNVKTNEYNENDDTKTYPAENENYVNQEYSYYDESQKEQTYPTEINEHEESTERYDPNYEQQYVNNYEDTINKQYQTEQYNVENSYDQQQNMYDHQQGEVNYQPENQNYEYAQMESVKDAEPNQNLYYTNNPQEDAQYEAQQLENIEIDQPDIAYTTSEDYDAQPEYITMHDKPQPIENLEQQLDVEDGYIPNSIKLEENEDYQEQVIEETTPEIQQTDIKVT